MSEIIQLTGLITYVEAVQLFVYLIVIAVRITAVLLMVKTVPRVPDSNILVNPP